MLTLAAVLLVGAAAAAGAAALSSNKTASPPKPAVPVASTPAAGAPTTSVPTVPTVPSTPGGVTSTPTVPAPKVPPSGSGTNGSLFPGTGKPPKIPATAPTPKSSGSGSSTSGSESAGAGSGLAGESEKGQSPSTQTGSGGSSEKQAEQPSALLLDTDAASTYNPYGYPATGFGDPALAIDGEALTAWTGQVQPSSAPNMAEGLLVNLKSPTKLGAVMLVTQTTGMTVQLYGTTARKPPKTITEQGWKQLSATHVLKKRATRVKLHAKPSLRYVLVWIVKAPASAVGTPTAPGHVDLNEVELFPPASSS